jgi:uncharacterized protein YbjT (DUF2867 family)
MPPGRALVTGATGFVGGRLAEALAAREVAVRCLVRDRKRGAQLAIAGHELCEGDIGDADSMRGACADVDVAYYLVHSMGRGNGHDGLLDRERAAARTFARAAREAGVRRVVYLGGLGENPTSMHLRSRHETALTLAREGPPLTYFRAAMVVGARSESYRTLRALVERLPVMIAPSWLRTRTQPIGIDDVIAYLTDASRADDAAAQEVQIGGPDVLSYGDMLDRMAEALGRRPRPMVPVPLLSPRLSSLWIGLVTPVDTGVARPLIEGLRTETVVTDPAPARRFGIRTTPFDETLRRAIAEDEA